MAARVDIGSIRRTQIVEAASRVINRKGIQNTSLAEIEQEADISRGVLTYHFPSKESIILAVFDAMIAKLKQGAATRLKAPLPGWERLENILNFLLIQKPPGDEFDCLHYTFLAQMSHREDFRIRLAAEYSAIRDHIAEDIAEQVRRGGIGVEDAKAVAAIIHGTISGLVMQINADPGAIDRTSGLRVFQSMIMGYLGGEVARGPIEPVFER